MSRKKPSPAPAAPASGQAPHPGHGRPAQPGRHLAANPRLQGDNRWQRTKRYGWNSR